MRPTSMLRSSLFLVLGGVLSLGLLGCGADTNPTVRSGAEVLAENDFEALEGQRVGLIVNHTAEVDTAHLIDRIDRAPNVELEALFAPEHGLRGTAGAGEAIEDGQDPQTGVPIYSLYGETRQPTPEMLDGLDALVFDIQDVGARFYTYITTMGLAMQAAAEADLPFFVLDRPNPLGGTYTSGFLLEPEHESFVGRYPIPIAHGLTIGELARFVQGEALLPGLDDLDVNVVSMNGWTRDMRWPDTGREWHPPSPNLPTWETALLYPGQAFFEGVHVNEGRGTERPFLQIGAPWPPEVAQEVVDTLQARDLPGVEVESVAFTPKSMPQAAPSPRFEGEEVHGFRLRVTNRNDVQPVEIGIHSLQAMYQQAQRLDETNFVSRPDHLTRLAGTERLREYLQQGTPPDEIIESWAEEVETYREQRSPYLLY